MSFKVRVCENGNVKHKFLQKLDIENGSIRLLKEKILKRLKSDDLK